MLHRIKIMYIFALQNVQYMKRILVILFALILPLCATAQKKGYKLNKEKSSKTKPAWVTDDQNLRDYLYVTGNEANNLEEAKNAALLYVVEDIAHSVAVIIESEVEEVTVFENDADRQRFRQEYTDKTKTKVAKMPALQGITIQNADIYYECYYSRKLGDEYYKLYMRYPFTVFERQEVIDAFNKQEEIINNKIKTLEDELEMVSSIEEITTNYQKLNSLKKELGDGDTRTNRINAILNLYNNICSSILIDVVENSPGHMVVRLVYDGRLIRTTQRPKASSTCAGAFDFKYENGLCHLYFDSEYCYPQDDPTIKIVFNSGNGKPISKQIRIKF